MNTDKQSIALVRRGYSSSGGAEKYLLRLMRGLEQRGVETLLISDRLWPQQHTGLGSERQIQLEAKSPLEFSRHLGAWATERANAHWKVLSLERVQQCRWYRAGDGLHRAWLQLRQQFEPAYRSWFRSLQAKHRQLLALESALAENTKTILCNSHSIAREWQQYYDVESERLAVIYNGFDPKKELLEQDRATLRGSYAEQLDAREDRLWLLFVGSGWERKGLPLLLQALEKSRIAADLLVAGRGRAGARRYGNSQVHWLGARRDVARLARAADLFVLPTWYDPFSNATLEAAAYGTPVITTTANGFHEVMQIGVHGEVVPPGDMVALASALRAWANKERCEDARERIAQAVRPYSVERNVNATLQQLGKA